MENKWLNIIHLLKRILILTETAYHLKRKKINEPIIKERSSNFWKLQKKINSDNLIYMQKTEARSPKDFRNYQNLIEKFNRW